MLCWFLPCSNTSQPYIYLYPLLLKPPFSPTPPHTSRSSQSTKRNSLFHTAASRQLFILHMVVITKRNTLTPVRMASTENIYKGGFPGISPVKNPPAIAADMSSVPGPGRSHVPWSKRSLCATTSAQSGSRGYWAHAPWRPRSATGEASAVRSPHTTMREQLPLATMREKLAQQWRPSTATNNKI